MTVKAKRILIRKTITLDKSLNEQVEGHAERYDLDFSKVVRHALRLFFEGMKSVERNAG